MYRHDYVLRLIERLGQVLRTLRDRLRGRELSNEDLLVELQEIAREAGLDVAFARRLDPATMVTWLAPTLDPAGTDRVWLMAELFYAEALAARAAGAEPQAAGDLRRALVLFGRISPAWRPGTDLASAGERVAEVRGLLHASQPQPAGEE
jgi:hypothetical protein